MTDRSTATLETLRLAAEIAAKGGPLRLIMLDTLSDHISSAGPGPAPAPTINGPFTVGEGEDDEFEVRVALYHPDNGVYQVIARCPERRDAEAIVRSNNELHNIKAGVARYDATMQGDAKGTGARPPDGDDYNELHAIVMQGGCSIIGDVLKVEWRAAIAEVEAATERGHDGPEYVDRAHAIARIAAAAGVALPPPEKADTREALGDIWS